MTLRQTSPQHKRRRRRRRLGDEEEPVLRTTCDACTSAKVKCNGEKPCTRCGNKNIQCEYTFKKRCGPKRRKAVPAAGGGGLLASHPGENGGAGTFLGFDDHLCGESTVLNKDDVECVDVFMQNINAFLPLTSFDAVRQAATAAAPAGDSSEEDGSGGTGRGGGGDVQHEERRQLHHARKAMLHGAIALGAEFLEREDPSLIHAGVARQEIKECFDAAVPELVAAHLILALYWTHQMDTSKINRYIGLAHQTNNIVRDPPGALVSSLTFVSVVLFDGKVVNTIGCRVDPPGTANKAGISPNNPTACQERVLNILSFVLLAIHNRSSSGSDSTAADPAMSTGEWDPKAMTEHVYEAKALLDKGGPTGPNDISRCIVVALQAYFLLLTNNRRQAIVVAEPLADLVADNPLVLHLPIVWSLIGCVRMLLKSASRTIAVERLQSAMAPLATHVRFSTGASLVEQELMGVFTGKPAMTTCKRKGGATTSVSAASAAAATATAGSAVQDTPMPESEALMRKHGGQTSSLNVTAEDFSHTGRSPINLLGLEPSAAPRRRGPPLSTIRQSPPPDGGGGGSGGVSPSLLSAVMISSGEPILASSPPASRAGALGRAPGTHGSMSLPGSFSEKLLMMQLDMPFMGGSFGDGCFGPSGVPMGPGGIPVRAKEALGIVGDATGVVVGGSGVSSGGRERMLQGDSGAPKLEGGRAMLMKRQRAQQSFMVGAPVSMSLEGGGGSGGGVGVVLQDDVPDVRGGDDRQGSFKANAPFSLDDDGKLEEDRRELMTKQQVQSSFVADAPVSLEQVESTLARLGVSSSQDESDSGLRNLANSMDLDATAEFLATKATHFIS